MSDTPRTDAAIIERRHIHKISGCVELLELVDADVARKLERECNQRKADWNKACDEQGFLMLECDAHRAKAAKLRKALQSVMDWNPKPEYWASPDTVARFEADMARAREVLEQTEETKPHQKWWEVLEETE